MNNKEIALFNHFGKLVLFRGLRRDWEEWSGQFESWSLRSIRWHLIRYSKFYTRYYTIEIFFFLQILSLCKYKLTHIIYVSTFTQQLKMFLLTQPTLFRHIYNIIMYKCSSYREALWGIISNDGWMGDQTTLHSRVLLLPRFCHAFAPTALNLQGQYLTYIFIIALSAYYIYFIFLGLIFTCN